MGLTTDTKGTVVYDGTYTIEVTNKDESGYPLAMEAVLTYKMTMTVCAGGKCFPSTETGGHMIPLIVHKQRCPIP